MWDQESEFIACLQAGLDAIERRDCSEIKAIARHLRDVARTSLADAPWWLLQGHAQNIVRLCAALADQGDREPAKLLLLATASFFTHTGAAHIESVRQVLSGDPHAVFEFVSAAHSPGIDLEAFGMDAATLICTLRERFIDHRATEADVHFALGYVHGDERSRLISLGLEYLRTSSRLWEAAAVQFLAAGRPLEAAPAYQRSLDVQNHAPESPARDTELLARLGEIRGAGHGAMDTHGDCGEAGGRAPDERTARLPGGDLPALVNLALLQRELHGPSAARDIVARYAPLVQPWIAAMAFLDAGAGDEALEVLIRNLRESLDSPDAKFTAIELARAYFALGRTIDAVAAMRVFFSERGDVELVLDHILGSCMSRHRLRYVGRWRGAFPADTAETIRAAAVDALVRECEPTSAEREEAITCLRTLESGSLEQRVAALASLRELGSRVSPVVREHLDTGDKCLHVRIGWLLERWAWEAAENRFRVSTGLCKPLPGPSEEERVRQDLAEMPEQAASHPQYRRLRMWVAVKAAIEHFRELEVEEANRLVDRICDESEGQESRIDSRALAAAIGDLVDLLISEGEVHRARRLLRTTGGTRDVNGILLRFRELLMPDADAGFDTVVSQQSDWRTFAALGFSDGDVGRIAAERLASGSLAFEATRWIFSHLDASHTARLLRPALKRFPKSPTLLSIAGHSLLAANRPRSALQVFDRCLKLRHEARLLRRTRQTTPADDDPDKCSGVHHEAVRVVAGYPPRIATEDQLGSPDPPGPRAQAEPSFGKPILVNTAILRYELEGRARALQEIERYSETESSLVMAASLRAIGECDAACTVLEHEVTRLGTRLGGDTLNGIIAAYAGAERMRDAIAVAGLVLGNHAAAKEHVDILMTTIIDHWNDNLPDEVLQYEQRFIVQPTLDAAVDQLIRRAPLSPEEDQHAKTLAERVGSENFGIRTEALATLRAWGPSASRALADTIPHLNDLAKKELRALLEAWAWDAEESRTRARLDFPPDAAADKVGFDRFRTSYAT